MYSRFKVVQIVTPGTRAEPQKAFKVFHMNIEDILKIKYSISKIDMMMTSSCIVKIQVGQTAILQKRL